MKIVKVTNKHIWERFISNYSPEALFQSWNWGETIKRRKAKSIWRLGIYDDKLVGIAQINKVTAKRGIFLHVRHGPIFSSWNKEYLEFFLDNLKDLAKKERASFIRISPLLRNSLNNQKFFQRLNFRDAPIHALDGELCWVLDLKKKREELLSDMRKTTRYLIRKAQKIGVKIIKDRSKKDLKIFLSLYNQTAKRHGFVPHKGIMEEFEEFVKDDEILLFKGYYRKKLLSAALILFYNHQAIYHHSASIEQKIPVNYLLQWEAIKEAKMRKKTIYNFWGIAPEKKKYHPWKGLTLFKKGFGGRQIDYLHAKDYPLSSLYWVTYLIESVRKVWKGY